MRRRCVAVVPVLLCLQIVKKQLQEQEWFAGLLLLP